MSLGLRCFCVAGVGQCALPRGRMYALRPSGVLWCPLAPLLLRGRRGQCALPRGGMYALASPLASLWRPSGVPLVFIGLRCFCVAGVGQCALPRGRMYALASLWRPSGVPWAPLLLRGRRGTMCTAKGWDVRPGVPLASLWRPLAFIGSSSPGFCVAGVGQCALPRGRMYALASLWRPSAVPWAPLLLRGRRETMCTAMGSDVRPGVPLASLWCPLGSAAFAWQAWDNVHCQGVGFTPWRPLASLWVPLVSLGLRCFCVAGVGQCALPRGRMYAPPKHRSIFIDCTY